MDNYKTISEWFSNLLQQETQNVIRETNMHFSHDLQDIINLNTTETTNPQFTIPKYFVKHYIDNFCQTIATRLGSHISSHPGIPKQITPIPNSKLRKKYISHECPLTDIIPPDFLLEPIYSDRINNALDGFHNFHKKLAFIDLETDGLDIKKANILQISIIIPNNKTYYVFNSFIKPPNNYRIDEKSPSFKVNNITQDKINNAHTFNEIAIDIADILHGTTVVGFNIHNFDLPILTRHFQNSEVKHTSWTFSIDLAQNFWKYKKLTLEKALQDYHLDPITEPHNALADTSACIRLMCTMIEMQQLPASFSDMIKHIEQAGRTKPSKNSNIIRANFDAKHPWLSKMWHTFPKGSREWRITSHRNLTETYPRDINENNPRKHYHSSSDDTLVHTTPPNTRRKSKHYFMNTITPLLNERTAHPT